MRQGHIYLYERQMDSEQPVEDITANKFSPGGYTLQFKPSQNIKKQEYDYVFAFEVKKQTIIEIFKVKKGIITIYGSIGPSPQIQFIKNDNNLIEIKLNKKVDQIKQNGHVLNILILGRVGLGKSSFIKNCMKMLNQLSGFKYQKLPEAAESDQTHTKQFQSHQLQYKNQINKYECQINLIDSPGLGGQSKEMTTIDFSEIFCKALKLLLNGELEYKKFNIPNQIDVEAAKIPQNHNKLIHYCLIFIKPQEVKEIFQIMSKIFNLLTQSHINYGLIINKSDQLLNEAVPTYQLMQTIKEKTQKENYKVQGFNNIFSTCLSPIFFPKNKVFYEQFQTSIYYSLSYAIQHIQNNIVNIYLQQNSNTQKLLQMVRIANSKTLQQFIQESKTLKRREIKDIEIKYKDQDKYKNVFNIIQEKDPEEEESKNLLYYRTKVNHKWKIVFRFRNKQNE